MLKEKKWLFNYVELKRSPTEGVVRPVLPLPHFTFAVLEVNACAENENRNGDIQL